MFATDVIVYLPKFKIETTTNLRDVLTKVFLNNLMRYLKDKLKLLIDNPYIIFYN